MIRLSIGDGRGEFHGIDKLTGVKATYPLHTHDFYEFFLVPKGRAIHMVNGFSHIVERGSLVFMRPRDEHCYDYYHTDDFELYNRGIRSSVFEQASALYGDRIRELTEPALPKHIKVSDSTLAFLEERFLTFSALTDPAARETEFVMLVGLILGLMLNQPDYNSLQIPPPWLLDILETMREPENFTEGLPRLLQLSNYSQEHINREFQRYLHTTPTRYINDLRLQYALRLLRESDADILTVAEQSGFNNLSHFYTEFKRLHGVSPGEIRRREH